MKQPRLMANTSRMTFCFLIIDSSGSTGRAEPNSCQGPCGSQRVPVSSLKGWCGLLLVVMVVVYLITDTSINVARCVWLLRLVFLYILVAPGLRGSEAAAAAATGGAPLLGCRPTVAGWLAAGRERAGCRSTNGHDSVCGEGRRRWGVVNGVSPL